MIKKLNLGAGNDIRDGYVNHDIVDLPKIDIVHNLNKYPWPWADSEFDDLIARDVIEHLDDFILAMEEIYRIMKPGATVYIKVPYWNSSFAYIDPTHKKGFHEKTFEFFDPEKALCKERGYYTNARFNIIESVFILIPFSPYLKLPFIKIIRVKSPISRRVIGIIGNLFSNLILDLELVLRKI